MSGDAKGEKLAPWAMYLGIFVIVMTIISGILNFIPFGGCFACMLLPFSIASFFAFFVAIGLGIAALVMGAGSKKMQAFIGIGCAVGSIFVSIIFFVAALFLT